MQLVQLADNAGAYVPAGQFVQAEYPPVMYHSPIVAASNAIPMVLICMAMYLVGTVFVKVKTVDEEPEEYCPVPAVPATGCKFWSSRRVHVTGAPVTTAEHELVPVALQHAFSVQHASSFVP